jgi:hypothetical protein
MIVENFRTWKWNQNEFREMYAEALAGFEQLQRDCTATLRECNAGTDLLAMKEYFESADASHKKVVALTSQLSLRFCEKVKEKKLIDWTRQEHADNALVRSLEGLTSTTMHHLQTAYRPWLAKAQFPAKAED